VQRQTAPVDTLVPAKWDAHVTYYRAPDSADGSQRPDFASLPQSSP